MRSIKSVVLCSIAAAVLVACGGGGNGDQSPRVAYSSMVNFGDSLSDVGTYKVGTVAALGGGMYNVNSASAKNWTQILASQLAVSTPCPAQTGLDGNAGQGFAVAVVNNTACKNYAQGGARVTNPVGPGNKLLGGSNAILGQLTVPLVTQVANHLGVVGGAFTGSELVTVMAGGNDTIMETETYIGTVGGGGNAATTAATAVANMTTAGTQLATLITTQITAKGAKYVVVVNLPNVSRTPYGSTKELALAGTKTVIDDMTRAFNTALSTGLASAANVIIVDAYSISTDQSINPAQYGLSNVTGPACDLTAPSPNALGSSLVCTTSNLNVGDVSKYLFADGVHPTPYGYQLLAQGVTTKMVAAGWL